MMSSYYDSIAMTEHYINCDQISDYLISYQIIKKPVKKSTILLSFEEINKFFPNEICLKAGGLKKNNRKFRIPKKNIIRKRISKKYVANRNREPGYCYCGAKLLNIHNTSNNKWYFICSDSRASIRDCDV